MSKGSVMLRLIDIVFLLLFGFLVISEIDKKSPINIPQSEALIERERDEQELLLIGITKDRRYYLESEFRYLPGIDSLKTLIKTRFYSFKKIDREMKVKIRSEWNLPIVHTLRIAQFCQEDSIPVALDMQGLIDKNK